jgi:phage-related tail fiber protein
VCSSDLSDDDRSPSPIVITTTTRGRKSGTVKIPKRPSTYNRKEKTPKRKKISAEARKSAAEARKVAAEMKKAAALAKKAAAEAKKAALEAKREKARVGGHVQQSEWLICISTNPGLKDHILF